MADPAYNYAHQQERIAAINAMRDGSLCPFCKRPMYKRMAKLLDYDHVIPVAMGGIGSPKRLAHRHCNRGQGSLISKIVRNDANYAKRRIGTPNSGTPTTRRRLPKW